MKRIALVFAILLALTGAGLPAAADEISDLPWTLRDHYTFESPRITLIYAVDNGEWCLMRTADQKMLLDKARTSVTLADGTTIDVNGFGPGDSFRNRDTTRLGNGSRYGLTLTGEPGLSVAHTVTSHKEHPYYLVKSAVTNTSAEPIEIAAISPIVVPRGAMAPLDPEVAVHRRTTTVVGPSVAYSPSAPVNVLAFHNAAAGYIASLGVLPAGVARSSIDLAFFDGQWQGAITSTFDPPLTVQPGQTIESDPIWLAFTLDTPERLDQFISYTHASLTKPGFDTDEVEAWATAREGEPLAAVVAAANEWASAGVKHALIPHGWEGRPGSREGASPAYPSNMRNAASQLEAAGVSPGITIDPLDIGKGEAPWALSSEDGHIWANPADAAGREAIAKAVRDVAGWGFSFYVVRPSNIPDAALKQFGITRRQADTLAYSIAIDSVNGLPVYRTPQGAIGTGLDSWLQAAICSTRLDEYDAVADAVRFDAAAGDVGDEVLMAMVLVGGPIEFVGSPGRNLASGLQHVLPKPRIWSRAVDACADAPKLWEMHMLMNEQQPTEMAYLAFPGAPSATGDVWPANGESLERLSNKFMSLRGVTKRPAQQPGQ